LLYSSDPQHTSVIEVTNHLQLGYAVHSKKEDASQQVTKSTSEESVQPGELDLHCSKPNTSSSV